MWVRLVGYLIGMILVAGLTGGFFLFQYLKPLEAEKARIDSEYKRLMQKKQQGTKLKQEIAQLTKEIADRKKEIVRLLKDKTKGRDVGQFLNDVEVDAKNSGVELKTVRIQPKTQRQLYIEIPMEFAVDGTYFQIFDFLNRIERRKMLNLTRSQISLSGGGGKGDKIKNLSKIVDKQKRMKDLEDQMLKPPSYSDEALFPVLRVSFDGRIIIIDKSHIAKYEEG